MRMLVKRRGNLWLMGALLAAMWGGGRPAVATALEVGQPAPDFTLPSTTGGKISLSEFRGKKIVLLEFYVHDFGPT